MKTTPIIMNSEQVRALMDGKKTQTRHVIKEPCNGVTTDIEDGEACITNQNDEWVPRVSPFGQQGDLMWVRETWGKVVMVELFGFSPGSRTEEIVYKAGRKVHRSVDRPENSYSFDDWPLSFVDDTTPPKWRRSIHMPRWASRLTLKITGVRVERLQYISEEDAQAEGIERVGGGASCSPWRDYSNGKSNGSFSAPSSSYRSLWQSIYGYDSWESNPWVWVIEFEVIQRNVDEIVGAES